MVPRMQSWSKLSSGFTVTYVEAQPLTAVTDLAALMLYGPLSQSVVYV